MATGRLVVLRTGIVNAQQDTKANVLLQGIGRGERTMSAVTWQQLIAGANTSDEVLAVCRDYVASMEHDEVARLPDACKPGKFVDTHDVASYAYDLMRRQLA